MDDQDSGLRKCPYCKEEIKADAVKCKHCHSTLAPEKPTHGGTCPYCKEAIHPEAVKCKHCGSAVGPGQGCEGCEGCGESAEAALMAARRGTVTIGTRPIVDPSCRTRYMACLAGCATKYGPLSGGLDDPMMLQACAESCAASYSLCRSLGGGITIY
jgi:hypothetical protein